MTDEARREAAAVTDASVASATVARAAAAGARFSDLARTTIARLPAPGAMIGVVVPLGILLFWEVAVRAGWIGGRLTPPPSRIFETIVALAASGELGLHIGATLSRVAAGFAIGAVAGTLAGALTGASPLLRRLLDPMLQALRAIPSIAWVPLFILWLGIFESSKIALIATGVFFPVYLGVMGAVMSVDRKI
ncbi:MAG: ABC transporter permease subunit, partial [Beijerinckiaceae bacterium]